MNDLLRRYLESGQHKTTIRLEKRIGDIDECRTPEERRAWLENTVPYKVVELQDNCLLNTGIDEIWELVAGASANHFDNSNATIGVGNSSTGAQPTDTDLLGASKTYKAMEATYPTHTTQKITFKSSFGSSDANYAWEEWVVKQSGSSICLNRKVESLGTKASGTTWTLEVSITLS